MAAGSYLPASVMKSWGRLSAPAKAVAGALGLAIRTRRYALSQRELARVCGYSNIKSVSQGLRELRALGLVERVERKGEENAYHWLDLTDREREWLDTGGTTRPSAKPLGHDRRDRSKPAHSAPPTHESGEGGTHKSGEGHTQKSGGPPTHKYGGGHIYINNEEKELKRRKQNGSEGKFDGLGIRV